MELNIKIILSFFILLNGCSRSINEVEIEVLNKELHFAAIFEEPDKEEPDKDAYHWSTNLYFDYQNEKDLKNSINVIKYKISNNTDKKIFLITNPYSIIKIEDSEKRDLLSGVFYQIKDNESQNIPFWIPFPHQKGNDNIFKSIKCLWTVDSLNFVQDSIRYKNITERISLMNYTYLDPKESVILESYLNLPIVQENKNLFDNEEVLPMYGNKEYTFQLFYTINKNKIEKALPKEILEELKRNGIEIIDMALKTEKLKITPL